MIRISRLVKREHLFFTFLVVLNLAYLVSRAHVVLIIVSLIFSMGLVTLTSLLNRKATKILIFVVGILYLFLTYYYFRWSSWDGNVLYLRNVLLLKDDFRISYFETPLFPYLGELFLAAILKFGSLRLMNLSFGVATVGSVVTTMILYRKLGMKSGVSGLALLLLLTSPTFLYFALTEFKIDMFLLVVANLSLVVFLQLLEKPTFSNIALLGILLVMGTLIKVLFLAISTTIIFLAGFELLKRRLFKGLALLLISFCVPIMLWAYYYGLYIKPEITLNSPYSLLAELKLERDDKKMLECIYDAGKNDSDRYLNVLSSRGVTGHANPGPFMYAGTFLVLLFPVLYKLSAQGKKVARVMAIGMVTTALYFVYVGVIYWYLFAIFPLISLVIAILIDDLIKSKLLRNFLIGLTVSTGLIAVLGPVRGVFRTGKSPRDISGEFTSLTLMETYKMNIFLGEVSQNSYVLDASEHTSAVFLPYLKDYDKKVIKSRYYFASAGKPLKDVYRELKQKKIDIIVVDKSKLMDPWYYKACPAINRRILIEFLNNYTHEIYRQGDSPVIFKLNET